MVLLSIYTDTANVDHLAYNVCQIVEPKTIEEALDSEQATEWRAAAVSEYKSLMENDTWDIRFYYVREAVQDGVIDLHYCPTNVIVADLLTKPLSKGHLRQAMGMNTITDQSKWKCRYIM